MTDLEIDKWYGRAMSGSLLTAEQLPSISSNIVRVFLSSTFSDMEAERNKLMTEAFPSLRDYCQQLGLEYQIVDMRWGVNDEATVDHTTTELCLKEIKQCQSISRGPNFVVLIGNRYGYRPLPRTIDANEFILIKNNAQKHGTDTTNLEEWYELDENAIPDEYVLKPITFKFKNYATGDEKVRKRHQDSWSKVYNEIRDILRIGATEAYEKGEISNERKMKYFMSVTEMESFNGILAKDLHQDLVSNTTLCFIRNITDLPEHSDDTSDKLQAYSDTHSDSEKMMMLKDLKHRMDMRFKSFNEKGIVKSDVKWSQIAEGDDRHLDILCNEFISKMKCLINSSACSIKYGTTNSVQSTYEEVMHHITFCRKKCESFCSREDDLLTKITLYLKQQGEKSPLVVYGKSGSGKTSVMAYAAKLCRDVLPSAVTIVRFLGTSPESSTIEQTLKSICLQLCFAFGKDTSLVIGDFQNLVLFFGKSIRTFPSKEKPLIIFLDSVDQLSAENGAFRFSWLPSTLSNNVYIVISSLPERDSIPFLDNLKGRVPKSEYIEVPAMKLAAASNIIDKWLEKEKRKVTVKQKEKVLNSFSQSPTPLFLKLLFDKVRFWRSSSDEFLPTTIKAAITGLFETLEGKHQAKLVSRGLAYITSSRSGLSEVELEDLMSCDFEILEDVYQHWDPPVQGVIRIPPLLWSRVKNDIGDYFVERNADGKHVLAWYHRQFWEVAQQRYLTDSESRYCHRKLADYFLNEYATLEHRINSRENEGHVIQGSPKVSPQPLNFDQKKYNLRRLNEAPFQLISAKDTESIGRLKLLLFGNYEWLLAKITATSVYQLLKDLSYEEIKDDEEIKLVRDALLMALPVLDKAELTLPGELTGRLMYFRNKGYPMIDKLLEELEHLPTATPVNGCLQPPGGSLITALKGHRGPVFSMVVTTDEKFLVTASREILVWDLDSWEMVHELSGHEGFVSQLEAFNKSNTVVSISLKGDVKTWDVTVGGDAVHILTTKRKMTCFVVTSDDQNIFTGCNDGMIMMWSTYSASIEKLFQGHNNRITFVRVTKFTGLLVSGSNDGALKIWSCLSGECLHTLPGSSLICVGLTTDQNQIIAEGERFAIKVWNLTSGEEQMSLSGHGKEVKDIVLSPSGKYLVSAADDIKVIVWDLKAGKLLHELCDHLAGVTRVMFTSDEKYIITGSFDNSVKVWLLATGRVIETYKGHQGRILNFEIVRNNSILVSTAYDEIINVWKIEENRTIQSIPKWHENRINCLVPSHDRKLFLIGSKDSTASVCRIENGELMQRYRGHDGNVYCGAFSHDDLLACTGSIDKTIHVWRISDGVALRIIQTNSVVHCMAQTRGNQIISGSGEGVLNISEIGSENSIASLEGHNGLISCIVLSADQSFFVSASYDNTLRTWSTGSRKCIQVLTGHEDCIYDIAITHDDRYVVSGSSDCTVRVWCVKDGKNIRTLTDDGNILRCLAVSHDDETIVCGSAFILIFDMHTGELIHKLSEHKSIVMGVALTHDDRFLVSCSEDNTILTWNLTTPAPIVLSVFHVSNSIYKMSFVENLGMGQSHIGVGTRNGSVVILKWKHPSKAKAVFPSCEKRLVKSSVCILL